MNINKEGQTFQSTQSEILIVGVSKNQEQLVGWLDFVEVFGNPITEWIKEGDIATDLKKLTKIPSLIPTTQVKRILFVGLGDRKTISTDELRESFGLVGKELHKLNAKKVTLWVDSFVTADIDSTEVSIIAAEGAGLGYYNVQNYKTSSNAIDVKIEEVSFITTADMQEIVAGFEVGQVYAEAVNEARTLVNLPGNILTSAKLADYAEELAKQYDFEIEILNKAQLEELGMGAILAVNKGSVEEPRVITIKYQATDKWEDVIGLVGKGVTFDTGGYSIKTKTGLVGMKGDMGGAAAVLGAMRIIGELRPSKNVIAVIGSTDNMISGDAFKPDDVITSYSGKTVEILNTDAEGRLVLADAVTYAKQQGANYIIDVATLTGGVITALGYDKTGALTNDETLFETFLEASLEAGEFVWRLPLTENDKKRIRKSDVADLNNSPGSDGHMIFGGGFVGEFVGDTPWIHLDIAGTSDAHGAHDLGPKGGTGVMVRTLATFIERLAKEDI
ncbi:leucyl aminopeptidase [Viridibacillus arvi]|uniref:leucyl aminopeptidase n=1 Tax=Viridibacillus arvi TaxID=263475 RepID=UPI003D2960BC